jgi:hypothetical protein
MGEHVYRELADRYIASSAYGPPNALYDRPTIRHLLGPVDRRRFWSLGARPAI